MAADEAKDAKPTRAAIAAGRKKEKENPLVGDADSVTVVADSSQYAVHTPFSRTTAGFLRAVAGAKFDRDSGGWMVPIASYDELKDAIGKVRAENVADREARLDIEALAVQTAVGAGLAADIGGVQVRDFHPLNVTLHGSIMNLNGRYAAQHTGQYEGMPQIVVHRLDDLDGAVLKGDRVGITYDDKGRGRVALQRTAEQDLDDHLGRAYEGVKVVENDGKYAVEFDYNPALTQRIQRIDGASFNRESKAWEVGTDKKEFLARAVRDMRHEYVADRSDHEAAEQIAREKIDGANVRDAFTADGQAYAGRIVGQNDRYVVQHTGRDYMVMHRAASLSETPRTGADVRVSYDKGRGQVKDRERTREHSNANEHAR